MPLPESIQKFIGQTSSAVYEVEKGAIARFAEAVGDSNPLYFDEEHARKSRYGSIVSPPGFFGWPIGNATADLMALVTILSAAGYSRILDGGIEWEFYKPIKAGDKLTAKTTVRNIMERTGKTGKAVFLFRDITYSDRDGDLVAAARQTTIHPSM